MPKQKPTINARGFLVLPDTTIINLTNDAFQVWLQLHQAFRFEGSQLSFSVIPHLTEQTWHWRTAKSFTKLGNTIPEVHHEYLGDDSCVTLDQLRHIETKYVQDLEQMDTT